MEIAYNIISINEDRADNKVLLHEAVKELGAIEHHIAGVNGRSVKQLAAGWKRHPEVKKTCRLRLGEIGIWLSTLDNWKWLSESDFDAMILLEDDAIASDNFKQIWDIYQRDLPDDFDFLTLWVPENQRNDYYANFAFDWGGTPSIVPGERNRDGSDAFRIDGSRLARVYQGYGCVGMLYSRKGAAKLYACARGEGTFSTSDCAVFINAHRGLIKGFAPRPDTPMLFEYNWKSETNIHNTPYV